MIVLLLGITSLSSSAENAIITDAEIEDNDSADNANIISVNNKYVGALSDNSDEDWYMFTLEKNGYITVNFSHSKELYKVSSYWAVQIMDKDLIQVEDSYKRWIVYGEEDLVTSNIGLSAGTYYIKISIHQYYHTLNPYQLDVDYTPSERFEIEKNDNFTNAKKIELNKDYQGVLSTKKDVDYYHITIPYDGKMVINYMCDHQIDPQLELIEDGKNTVIMSSTGVRSQENNYYSACSVLAGEYYIRLNCCNYHLESHMYDVYTINVSLEKIENNEYEVNDSILTATEIQHYKKYYGAINEPHDVDFYRLLINHDSEWIFNAQTIANTEVYLCDEDGNEIKTIIGGRANYYGTSIDKNVSLGNLARGTYYIKFSYYRSSTLRSNNYSFIVSDTHEHIYSTWQTTVEPTCITTGEKISYCEICNKQSVEQIPVIEDHLWMAWEHGIGFDCTKGGVISRICKVCEYKEVRSMGISSHDYNDWEIITNPTCEKDGQEQRKCSVCGHTMYRAIEKLGHDYKTVTVIKNATCVDPGLELQRCLICNSENEQQVGALGHDYSSWVVEREPTCIGSGVELQTCSMCKYENRKPIPPLDHLYGEWKVLVEATCTQEGTRTQTCIRCDAIQSEIITKVEHEYCDFYTVDPSTCVKYGLQEKKCNNCGFAVTQVLQEYGDHKYEWQYQKAKTLFVPDKEINQCVYCNNIDSTKNNWQQVWYQVLCTVVIAGATVAMVMLVKKKNDNSYNIGNDRTIDIENNLEIDNELYKECLDRIFNIHKINILTERDRVNAFLRDYQVDEKAIRRILLIYESGAADIIHKSKEMSDIVFRKAVLKYCDYSDVSVTIACDVISLFFDVLGKTINSLVINEMIASNTKHKEKDQKRILKAQNNIAYKNYNRKLTIIQISAVVGALVLIVALVWMAIITR